MGGDLAKQSRSRLASDAPVVLGVAARSSAAADDDGLTMHPIPLWLILGNLAWIAILAVTPPSKPAGATVSGPMFTGIYDSRGRPVYTDGFREWVW